MGKGDKRSKKGKIFKGSHGKSRPKNHRKGKPVITKSAEETAKQ